MIELLHRLGIDRRNLRALTVLPLIEIAWADGAIQPKELALIRRKVGEWRLRHDDQVLLENWVRHPPSPAYLRIAHTALAWLREFGDPTLDPVTLHHTVEDARRVAASAGGFLGFGSICRAEREALAVLASELNAPVEEPEEADSHPDFVRKNGAVTLAWTEATLEESDAILAPLFDLPLRLPVSARGLLVGSGTQSDIRIVGDPGVRDQHTLVFQRPGEGFFARAVGGPLWVNGERVAERRLLGGETLRVTDATSFVFKFVRPAY